MSGFVGSCQFPLALVLLTNFFMMKVFDSSLKARKIYSVNRDKNATIAEMRIGPIRVDLQVYGITNLRTRRAIALILCRKVSKIFEITPDGTIHHRDGKLLNFELEEQRGINLHQSLDPKDHNSILGFRVRISRLEIGLSQTKLARMAKICRSHLSDLERGKTTATDLTLIRIRKALAKAVEPTRTDRSRQMTRRKK
ncbi:MAG: hypothetical protein A3K03_08735 [Bdellovibrionales bacterium RIFOXYD1_FULL_44_7]|nr:MAG: hypothetical protein A3K03_08735 [Bdellovibrionales bacterium RIFOXYD1_FULL_44_7]